ncbi:MAG TPA: PIN domain-containing protein [Desulfobacterales bacterium]|nr:PIN domain-containing protein [Desulfobacterales bacterium]
MIAVDTNILVYAHREEFPLHKKALKRIKELAEGREPWALPVFCLTEFLRIVTHPRLLDPPSDLRTALEVLNNLLKSPSLVLLRPGQNFWAFLNDIVIQADARGNLVFDAQIVALCKEYGIRDLLSEDRDFTRFKEITLHTL